MRRNRRKKNPRSEELSFLAKAPFLTRKIGTYDILDEEGLIAIEKNADRILAEVGVEVRNDPPSLELFRQAGAYIKGERVRFEPGFCKSLILEYAPNEYFQRARNPKSSVKFGKNNMVFSPGYGAPFVRSFEEPRRYARLCDFENIVKLAHISPYFHHTGGTVCEPTDINPSKRHLNMNLAHIIYSDKPYMGTVTSEDSALDSIKMCEIVFGEKFLNNNCCIMGLINLNSPLVLDGTMLAALRTYASANQCCVITPFVIGGAGGPMSPAGMLSQSLAETLAGMALTQLVRKGAPVMFGYLSTGLNMRTGSPVRYDETYKSYLAAGQLARRLGVPFRCGSSTANSKTPDYQAGLETALNFLNALYAGTNFFIHASGHLEGGLCLDFDKLILDSDMLGIAIRLSSGISTSVSELAFEDIKQVGPGGNFFSSKHTLENYKYGYFSADIFNSQNFEQWSEEGEPGITATAMKRRKFLLDNYQKPVLDSGIEDGLLEFIKERKSQISDT